MDLIARNTRRAELAADAELLDVGGRPMAALQSGTKVAGGAPHTDGNPHRALTIARGFGAEFGLHLDLGHGSTQLDRKYVCDLAIRYGRGSRTAIGHVTKRSADVHRGSEAHGRQRRNIDRTPLDGPMSDGPAHGAFDNA